MKKILLSLCLLAGMAGAAAAQTYPLRTIHDLQYRSLQDLALGRDTSLYDGDTVQFQGVVTYNPCYYGLSNTGARVGTFVQTVGGGPWSGVHVLIDGPATNYGGTLHQLDNATQFISNFQPGNMVKATGIVSNFAGMTQILLLPDSVSHLTGIGSVPAPHVATIDSFDLLNTGTGNMDIQRTSGEKWEGAYVEFDNVRVVGVSAGTGSSTGRWFWNIEDAAGDIMPVRDLSGWVRNDTFDNFCTPGGGTPANFDPSPWTNATLSYIKGVILEYKPATTPAEYYITPLTLSDIGPIAAAPPIISQVHLAIPNPGTTQAQTVFAQITDVDGSVASAMLYYNTGLGNTTGFTPISMTHGSGNTWSAGIPAMGPDSTYVNYWIRAIDNQGNHTNFPDSLATHSFYLILNSGVNSIHDVQYNPQHLGNSIYTNDTLVQNTDIEGTVMSTLATNDLGQVAIQSGTGPFQGIVLQASTGDGLDTLKRGDKIKITGCVVTETFAVTTLNKVHYQVTSRGNILYNPITTVPLDSVRLGSYNDAEGYESMFLGYDTVYVINPNPDNPSNFGEWSIKKDTIGSVGLRCDDFSNDIPATFNTDSFSYKQPLCFLNGILTYSFGNWKLLPRNRDDICGYHAAIVSGIPAADAAEGMFKLYPNPGNGLVNIEYLPASGHASVGTLQIFDLSGKMQMEQPFNGNRFSVDLTALAPGVYLAQIRSAGGSVVKRLIKL